LGIFYQAPSFAKQKWQSFLFSEVSTFFAQFRSRSLTGTKAQKLVFISAFSPRFFPNTPAKMSDTRITEHEVLHEIA